MMSCNGKRIVTDNMVSAVESVFWNSIGKLKLDDLRLSEGPVSVSGYFEPGRKTEGNVFPSFFHLSGSALESRSLGSFVGNLYMPNSLENFKEMDKQALFQKTILDIESSISSSDVFSDPTLLMQFLVIVFADLKKHRYYYWFAFPAFIFDIYGEISNLDDIFSQKQKETLKRLFKHHSAEFCFLVQGEDLKYLSFGHLRSIDLDTVYVVMKDPSSIPECPGWPLRNLTYLFWNLNLKSVRVLCCRNDLVTGRGTGSFAVTVYPAHTEKSTGGWERNKGKLAPQVVDLSSIMDKEKLAEAASSLNLSLMKWRINPDIELAKIANTKCLLFGAGTLGCSVARCLLGWGVRKITFVDCGNISFSNPPRQSLYAFEDVGKEKAKTAALNLKSIYPLCDAQGHNICIPMPGHKVINETETDAAVEMLDTLCREHDAVFLLLDSREARWFPSVLGAYHDKIIIDAALGFDSFLVMRHSLELGCYFCTDIVGPMDSISKRTLDQQCTVSRPGLSFIAGATAAELLAGILNHPKGNSAPINDQGTLGFVPHQIRGYLNPFKTNILHGTVFEKCTACSKFVLNQYNLHKGDFVKNVCNDPIILKEITGLNQIVVPDEPWCYGE